MAVVNKIPELLDLNTTVAAATSAAPGWVALNSPWIAGLIKAHKTQLVADKVAIYQSAYDSFYQEIDDRDKSRGDDVNHKLQASMAQLVIDTVVDYMLGKPIVWSFKDLKDLDATTVDQATLDSYRRDLLELLETEDAQRVLRELMTQGGVAGVSAIIGWVDELGKIDYEEFPYQEILPVYDTRSRLRLVIRYYQIDVAPAGSDKPEYKTRAEIYDSRYVTTAIGDEKAETFTIDAEEVPNVIDHKAVRIPVAVFLNGTPARYTERVKKAGVSDLQSVFSLLPEYAGVMSDKGNTVDRLQDQFLKFTGVEMGATKAEAEAEVMAMHKARAIALKSPAADAAFISPSQDDAAVENHLDRVRDTIYDMAFIPKLNDISGATATEIKIKYAPLDIKAGKKETYFKGAIKYLLSILTDFLNVRRLVSPGGQLPENYYEILTGTATSSVKLYNPAWVEFTLNRNLPQNYLELAQIVGLLAGKVPDSYLYELLWFIPDPQAALEAMKAQNAETAKQNSQAGLDAMGLGGEFGSTGTGGGSTPPAGGTGPGAAGGGA